MEHSSSESGGIDDYDFDFRSRPLFLSRLDILLAIDDDVGSGAGHARPRMLESGVGSSQIGGSQTGERTRQSTRPHLGAHRSTNGSLSQKSLSG